MQSYNISHGATLHLLLRLRGGGTCPEPQMSISAGGKIKQTIVVDKLGNDWETGSTTVFNVQILNSAVYKAITGRDPSEEPISAETYKEHGMPVFKIHVKCVAEIDGSTEGLVEPDTIPIGSSAGATVAPGLVNSDSPLRPFRTVHDLRREYSSYHVANF